MKILSVDCSSSVATVAILDENKLISEVTFNNQKQHSIILMDLIDSTLKTNKLKINDIEGFVVSKGPGSFTGLRIGMATIKGLCLGSNKPFVSISTLDALAYNVINFKGIICPIMDALRDNVYCKFLKSNGKQLEDITDYLHLSIDEVIEKSNNYNEEIIFVGDGLNVHFSKLKENISKSNFPTNNLNIVKASSLGELGLKKILNGDSDDLNTSAPLYLRKSQAEREYDKKMGLLD